MAPFMGQVLPLKGPLMIHGAVPRRLLLACVVVSITGEAAAVTPESREVQALVEQGVSFLENSPIKDKRLGARVLVGLAVAKSGRGEERPKVAQAIEACRAAARDLQAFDSSTAIYELSVAIIFLCELDSWTYAAEIKTFVRSLESRQKSHGGWGYPAKATGDTSMTQFAVLALWEAQRAGFAVSHAVLQRVADWLIRTQDPSGAWGYQGVDPGYYTRVPQHGIRHSLSAGGAGSLLICVHLLGLEVLGKDQREPVQSLPPVLKPIETERKNASLNGASRERRRRIRNALEGARKWFTENYQIEPESWKYYYLYALERYMTFRELTSGQAGRMPDWYDEGVRFLAAKQLKDGEWYGMGGVEVDTAFALMFLIRSMRQSIQKTDGYGDGTLIGGRGLPRNVDEIQMRGGQVLGKEALPGRAVELIKLLSDPDDPNYAYVVRRPDEFVQSISEESDSGEVATQLRRLVSTGAPEARRVAVRALGRRGNLDLVPTLLYAMTDPDWQVAREAHNALRLISRNFDAHEWPEVADEAARRVAMDQWRAWYLAIRPDAKLND